MHDGVERGWVRGRWTGTTASVLLALVVCLAGTLWSHPASACGMAWGAGTLVPPKPADEQVMLVWDRATQTQHFVRQVRFSDAGGRFGFIVPTPSKPTLHDIKAEPWERLNQRCAPSWSGRGSAFRGGIGFGLIGTIGHGGGGRGSGAAPPTVLEERKLGEFTAFVLEASDAQGFSAWLKKNGFNTTPELTTWLEHYIKLSADPAEGQPRQQFYFTALRFDGKPAGAAPKTPNSELTSKTVHISFKTANPYYPYLEPLPAAGAKPLKERKLQVWFISDQLMQPVTRYSPADAGSGGGGSALVRPWSETYPCDGALADVSNALGGELGKLITAQKYMQVFADLKTSRAGYGDVLLHPFAATSCDAECQTSRAQLVKLLQAEHALMAPPASDVAPQPYLPPPSCGVGGTSGRSGLSWLCAAGLLWGFRWRRARVVTSGHYKSLVGRLRRGTLIGAMAGLCALLVGCKTETASTSALATASSVTPSASSNLQPLAKNRRPEPGVNLPADAAAERALLTELLAGELAAPQLPVHATDEHTGLGGVTDVLPTGAPDITQLYAACVGTPGVEALLRVRADYKDARITEVELQGPLSAPALSCIRAAFLGVRPADAGALEQGSYTSRFALGLGTATPQQLTQQGRFAPTILRGVASQPVLRFSKAVVKGALPPEVVQRVLRSRFGRFRYCLAEAPEMLKSVKLTFTIDSLGAVKNGARSVPGGGSSGDCLRAQVEQIKFPHPERGEVQVSFELTRGAPAPTPTPLGTAPSTPWR